MMLVRDNWKVLALLVLLLSRCATTGPHGIPFRIEFEPAYEYYPKGPAHVFKYDGPAMIRVSGYPGESAIVRIVNRRDGVLAAEQQGLVPPDTALRMEFQGLPDGDYRAELWIDGRRRGAAKFSVYSNSFEWARAVEKSILARRAGRVFRLGDRLVLKLSDGTEKVFQDQLENGEDDYGYSYHGYIDALGFHLLHIQLYESDRYALVDPRRGRTTHIDSPPVISPDKSRFVTASLKIEGPVGGASAITVWVLTPEGPKPEWSLDLWESGFSDAVWIDNATVRFNKCSWSEKGVGYKIEPAVLVHTSTGWQMRDAF